MRRAAVTPAMDRQVISNWDQATMADGGMAGKTAGSGGMLGEKLRRSAIGANWKLVISEDIRYSI